mmetsp:Transcript_85249/g.178150  ORF Transcript_85249/g.178150 Transcript_85249/m.178150 type:complete len:682 (+) Transcript_85249:103-2148(+)
MANVMLRRVSMGGRSLLGVLLLFALALHTGLATRELRSGQALQLLVDVDSTDSKQQTRNDDPADLGLLQKSMTMSQRVSELVTNRSEAMLQAFDEYKQDPSAFEIDLANRLRSMVDEARLLAVAPAVFVCTIFLLSALAFSFSDRPNGASPSSAALLEGLKASPSASFLVVLLLTSYRFFTGFLNATWMSFLIAKEGSTIAGDRQAFMMAGCKLIFGGTIILNPVLGLLNDRLSLAVSWCGRAAFLLIGVVCGTIGIVMCMSASTNHDLWRYIIGCLVWMLGEAIADTTTEAIVPEYIAPSQFHFASSVRSLHFVLGGITGYAAIVFNEQETNHQWLYLAYLMLMFTCAFATVLILQRRTPTSSVSSRIQDTPMLSLIIDSYTTPLRYSAAFSLLCISLTLFSMGTGPIFFTLLFVRDLVDIGPDQRQQDIFGKASIVFLLFAAASSIFVGLSGNACDRQEREQQEQQQQQQQLQEDEQQHWQQQQQLEEEPEGEEELEARCEAPAPGTSTAAALASAVPAAAQARRNSDATSGHQVPSIDLTVLEVSVVTFAIAAVCVPLVHLPETEYLRILSFFIVASFLGLAFGAVYARFQTLIWFVLPSDADFANALGFSAVCKVAGCGIGNFITGLLLDTFRVRGLPAGVEKVEVRGYVVMCCLSSFLVIASAIAVRSIPMKRSRF